MRFAHIADTHLGYRQFNLEERELDFYRTFGESVDRMIEEGVEVVVHSGDLFDEPRPPIRALVEAKRGLTRLVDEGIRVVMIPGNHDMLMRRGSLAPHALFDGVDILSFEKPFVAVDDVFFGGVPYMPKSYRDVLLEKIRDLESAAGGYDRRVLLLHQGVDKFLPHEHELSIGEMPSSFDYIALGHVHHRAVDSFGRGVICYPGSTENWRSEEALEWAESGKGFYLVDSDLMEPVAVNLDTVRPFIRDVISNEEDITRVRETVGSYVDPLVYLVVKASDDYPYLSEKVKGVLEDKVLYLAMRRGAQPKVEKVMTGEAIDIKKLINGAMEEFEEGEKDLAYDLFKLLSKGDVDEALKMSEDFFLRWQDAGGS